MTETNKRSGSVKEFYDNWKIEVCKDSTALIHAKIQTVCDRLAKSRQVKYISRSPDYLYKVPLVDQTKATGKADQISSTGRMGNIVLREEDCIPLKEGKVDLEITFTEPTKPVAPNKTVTCLISLKPVADYLIKSLECYICEPEVAYSVLNLITTAVLKTAGTWTDYDEIDTAIQYLSGIEGATPDAVGEMCRSAEAMIINLIVEHIPDYGADWYHGQTTFEIVRDEMVKVTIDVTSFTNSQTK
jgi:hypothetical protein